MNSERVVPEKILKNHRFTLPRFYLFLVIGMALHMNKCGCIVLRNIELGPIEGVGKTANDQIFTFLQSPPEERVMRKPFICTNFTISRLSPLVWGRPDSSLKEIKLISSY